MCSGHEFCMCWLLHVFCKFLANQYRPRTWLSVESQWNVDSNDILSVRKYSQLFMHESNTFLLKIRHWNQWANGGKKPKTAPFPWGKWTPHLVHQYLDPTHWPLQMTARSVYALRYNYARKSILVRMGCPKFTPKTAPSLQRLLPPYNTSISQPTSLTIPNSIQIQSAILPQYTFRTNRHIEVRPTHTQTNRWARWQISKISTYTRYIDREWRANNTCPSASPMSKRCCCSLNN